VALRACFGLTCLRHGFKLTWFDSVGKFFFVDPVDHVDHVDVVDAFQLKIDNLNFVNAAADH